MNVSVRAAETADFKHLASFLPRWRAVENDEGLVAEATLPARIIGFSLLGRRPGDDAKPACYLDVAVLPRFCDAGVFRQLVSPLIERAAQGNVPEILLATPRRREAPEFGLLGQLGFEPYRSLILYEFSLPEFAKRAFATHDRLVRRQAIPPGAQVAGLEPAHWPAAVRLLRSERLMDSASQAQAERDGLDGAHSPASSVVTLDGELKGVVLTHPRGRQLETSALAVDSRLRGGAGWVNALLSWRVATIGPALGHEVITMSADPVRHPMTTRLAQRMDAKPLQTEVLLRKPLT